MFLSSLALLSQVRAAIAALRFHQEEGPAAAAGATLSTDATDPLLFQRVEFFQNKNAEQALASLRLMQDRIGIVIPVGDDYRNERHGNAVLSERSTDFMVLILDRSYELESRSGVAPSRYSPGILGIKDLTIEALTRGSLLVTQTGLSASQQSYIVACEPGPGSPITLEWEDKDRSELVARQCWGQLFKARNLGVTRIGIGRR